MACICKGNEAAEEAFFKAESIEQVTELESPLSQRDSRNILENLSLNSFENVLNVFESFLSDITHCCGDTNFLKAAHALDIAGTAVGANHPGHDSVMTKKDLDHLVAQNKNPEDSQALRWLSSNFDHLEKLCFFSGGIARFELDAARDVFCGLSYLQENSEKVIQKTGDGKSQVSDREVIDYLQSQGAELDEHHERGLGSLVAYLAKIETSLDRQTT